MRLLNQRRTKAVNELRKVINKMIPEVYDLLKDGFQIKKDGSLFQKQATALKEIFLKHQTSQSQRFWLEESNYNVLMRFKTSYYDTEEKRSCSYAEESQYIIRHDYSLMSDSIKSSELLEFNKRNFPTFTEKQVENKYNKIRDIEKKIKILQDSISEIKNPIRNHIR